MCQLVQHGPTLAAGPVGQGPVQGVGHGLDALFGQRLETYGQIRPTQQAARGEGDFNAVGQIGLGRLAHEELAHLIGVIHHRFAQILRQSREALAEQLPWITQLQQSARSRLDTLTGQLRALGSAGDIDAQLQQCRQQLQQLQGEYDAIALAMTVLDEANTTLQNRFSPALGARAAEIFSKITAGRYQKVLLSRDLSLETDSEGAQRSVQLLSQGAADQLYLAVRLAICDLVLPEDKHVPLILDDALLTFDDDRLHAALDYLLEESEKRQILLFTCQKREGAYLNGHKNVTLLAI